MIRSSRNFRKNYMRYITGYTVKKYLLLYAMRAGMQPEKAAISKE